MGEIDKFAHYSDFFFKKVLTGPVVSKDSNFVYCLICYKSEYWSSRE